jgi:hypothetical protein
MSSDEESVLIQSSFLTKLFVLPSAAEWKKHQVLLSHLADSEQILFREPMLRLKRWGSLACIGFFQRNGNNGFLDMGPRWNKICGCSLHGKMK